jgi:hypothetical protein
MWDPASAELVATTHCRNNKRSQKGVFGLQIHIKPQRDCENIYKHVALATKLQDAICYAKA